MNESQSKPIHLNIPIAENKWAALFLVGHLTQTEWDQMLKVLDAMKTALILEEKQQNDD